MSDDRFAEQMQRQSVWLGILCVLMAATYLIVRLTG